jgi:hypothetical protein
VIETPRTGARGDEVKKDEAERDGDFSHVVYGKSTSRKVRSKVSHGHLAADNESRDASEQAEKQQHSSDNFHHACDSQHRKIWETRERRAWGVTEQLLCAVLEEKKRGNNPQDTQQVRSPIG